MKKGFPILLIFLFSFLLFKGPLTLKSSQMALSFWFENLVPSLFIFMIFGQLILNYDAFSKFPWITPLMNHVFNLSKRSASLVLSCLFLGAPSGAILINQMVKDHHITSREANRLVSCLTLASPSFIIITCGTLFLHSTLLGFYLWGIQCFLCLLFLYLTKDTPVNCSSTTKEIPFFSCLTNAIRNSGLSLFLIGGYLLLFLTLFNTLTHFLPTHLALPFQIISEFSIGCAQVSKLALPLSLRFSLISAVLGLNGLCVHFQVFSLCDEFKINRTHFFLFRTLQSFLSFLLGLVLFSLLL